MKITFTRFFLKILQLFCITLLLTACENDLQTVKNLGSKGLGIDEGKNIESFMSTGGKVKAKLTAPVMLRYQLDVIKTEFPATLAVDFYDSAAKVESKLRARYANYLENDHRIFLRDSVIVSNRTGDTLWCKELYWDQIKEIFYTDKPVIISQQQPRQKIYGLGLRADQNFRWFTIEKVGKVFTGKQSFVQVQDSL